MIPSQGEIRKSLDGAILLALRRPGALSCFNITDQGFWNSFFALVLAAPIQIWFVNSREAFLAEGFAIQDKVYTTPPIEAFVAVETLTYVLSWTVFPFVMVFLSRLMGAAQNYVAYIIARNWASLLIYIALVIPPTAFYNLGILSAEARSAFFLALLIVELVYLWRVAVASLKVSGAEAAMLVAVDLILAVIMTATFQTLFYE